MTFIRDNESTKPLSPRKDSTEDKNNTTQAMMHVMDGINYLLLKSLQEQSSIPAHDITVCKQRAEVLAKKLGVPSTIQGDVEDFIEQFEESMRTKIPLDKERKSSFEMLALEAENADLVEQVEALKKENTGLKNELMILFQVMKDLPKSSEMKSASPKPLNKNSHIISHDDFQKILNGYNSSSPLGFFGDRSATMRELRKLVCKSFVTKDEIYEAIKLDNNERRLKLFSEGETDKIKRDDTKTDVVILKLHNAFLKS